MFARKPLFLGLLFAALLAGMAGALAVPHPAGEPPTYAPDRILVKFLPGAPDGEREEVHGRRRGRVQHTLAGLGVQVVSVPRNRVKETVKAYQNEPGVEFAEPDYFRETLLAPRDPGFSQQWGMAKIQAPEAWDLTRGSGGLKIAILDTGIDQDHEDLASKIAASVNFTTSDTVDDRFGHGTHVAGIAAAITDNGKGVAGVGFGSSLMNVKVLDDDGRGSDSWIAMGIIWAADNGAAVINLSLGSPIPSDTLRAAVDYAWNKGVVVIAAAGNSNSSGPIFPAFFDNVINVGATDQNDAKARFSNFGPWVDVAAPGVGIFSTMPNHDNALQLKDYGVLNGTSMAAPHVAGAPALIMAADSGQTNNEVRRRIEKSTDPTTGFANPTGRINAYKALTAK